MNPLRKAENYKVTRVLTNQPTEIIQWDLSSDGRKIENVAELLVIYIHFTPVKSSKKKWLHGVSEIDFVTSRYSFTCRGRYDLFSWRCALCVFVCVCPCVCVCVCVCVCACVLSSHHKLYHSISPL